LREKKNKKWHIRPIISKHAGPILAKRSALIDMWERIIKVTLVFRSIKGRCYGNQLMWGLFLNDEIDRLQFLLWRSETECIIAICITALTLAMMQLRRVKI